MKYLIAAALAVSLLSASNANALGNREEGVLIGLGSAILLGNVYRNSEARQTGSYGDYGYGGYGDDWPKVYGPRGGSTFPPFRCRGNSVDCAYQRGVWEREREIWLQAKDDAYMCGRYPEKCGGGRR